jgi:hypothetical protein
LECLGAQAQLLLQRPPNRRLTALLLARQLCHCLAGSVTLGDAPALAGIECRWAAKLLAIGPGLRGAAGEAHLSRSASHSAGCTRSSSSLRSRLNHLSFSSPSVTTDVSKPNGSGDYPDWRPRARRDQCRRLEDLRWSETGDATSQCGGARELRRTANWEKRAIAGSRHSAHPPHLFASKSLKALISESRSARSR